MEAVKGEEVPLHLAADFRANPGRYWDLFYRRHGASFFKDRHWFSTEFPRLLSASVVLELGCGAGNTAFPLIDLLPSVRVYACDFATTAVDLVQNDPRYQELHATDRLTAFVADITAYNLVQTVPVNSIDTCTMIYVLSAIEAKYMPRTLLNVARTMTPGGVVLFRDYAAGDLAQRRFQKDGRQKKVDDGLYARGDGTFAYYFSIDFARKIFEDAGFRCDEIEIISKPLLNKKQGLEEVRSFLQAVFTYTGPLADAIPIDLEPQQEEKQETDVPESIDEDIDGDAHTDSTRAVQLAQGFTLQLSMLLRSGVASGGHCGDMRSGEAWLAQVLWLCPNLLRSKNVVQLQCGSGAAPCFAALRWCRRAVATDTNPAAISLLKHNIKTNGHLFVVERLRYHTGDALCPDNPAWRLKSAFPQGFDIVLVNLQRADDGLTKVDEVACAVSHVLREQGGLVAAVCQGAEDGSELAAAAGGHGLLPVELPDELQQAVSVVAPPEGRQLKCLYRN